MSEDYLRNHYEEAARADRAEAELRRLRECLLKSKVNAHTESILKVIVDVAERVRDLDSKTLIHETEVVKFNSD